MKASWIVMDEHPLYRLLYLDSKQMEVEIDAALRLTSTLIFSSVLHYAGGLPFN